MGMWKGIRLGLQDAEERKLNERKMQMAEEQLADSRRNKRLDLLLSYRKSSKATSESAKTKATTLKRLRAVGFPTKVAEFLTYSGEGEEILKVYDKKAGTDELSPQYIPSVIAKVNKHLGDKSSPQSLAIATKAVLLSTEDLSTAEGQAAGLVEAIYAANTMDDFSKVDEQLIEMFNSGPEETVDVAVPPIGGLTRGVVGVDETKLKNIRNMVVESVAPTYGQIFIKNEETGGYTIDPTKIKAGDAQVIQNLIDEATTNIVSDIQGVDAVDLNTSIQAHSNYAIKMAPQILGQKEEDENELPDTPSGGLGTGVDYFGAVAGERD